MSSENSNLDDSVISLPAFPSRNYLKLQTIHVTPKLVKNVTANLDFPKASGSDFIPVVLLKNFEPDLSCNLTKLFILAFRIAGRSRLLSQYLRMLGERSMIMARNYRPVSLLSVFSKVFGKFVNSRLFNHLNKFGLLYDFQSGFRSS